MEYLRLKETQELEKILEELVNKRWELENKISKCRNEQIYNGLLTSYATLCALIVDIDTALLTLMTFNLATLIRSRKLISGYLSYNKEYDTNEKEIKEVSSVLKIRKKWELE